MKDLSAQNPSDNNTCPDRRAASANILLNSTSHNMCSAQQNGLPKGSRYHFLMEEIAQVKSGFAQRLYELRSAKGVSARETSLSLGQGTGYVSNLEKTEKSDKSNKSEKTTDSAKSSSSKSFRASVDEYEEFIDEYVDFMEEYTSDSS